MARLDKGLPPGMVWWMDPARRCEYCPKPFCRQCPHIEQGVRLTPDPPLPDPGPA
jgi:hypothetical protein